MKSKPVLVRFSPNEIEALKELAKHQNMNLSTFIRFSVSNYLMTKGVSIHLNVNRKKIDEILKQ